MYRILLLTLLLLAATPWGSAKSDAAPADSLREGFTPKAAAIIEAFAGVKAPVLPDMSEKRALIARSRSAAPGRMLLPRKIIVNKDARRLVLVSQFGDTLLRYPVCSSRNRGQKRKKDDCRTPEGTFSLYGIYNSTDWTYKDTDSKCYGPWFLSLHTPGFWGIGIHGTNAPGSIPGRSSHGCMRLHNENVTFLKQLVTKDLKVTIIPDRNVREDEYVHYSD